MKKIMALLLVVMVATSIGGCKTNSPSQSGGKNNKKNPNAKVIEIYYNNTGLSTGWINGLIEGFEKKQSEYVVKLNATAGNSPTWGMPDVDQYDLYFGLSMSDTTYLSPLEDILDTTIEGEAIPIREKFLDSYKEGMENLDGTTYQLTYGGGIFTVAYNKDIFNKAGITQLPRTTKEMSALVDKLSSKDITPLCHFKSNAYYDSILAVFQAQYDGVDYFKNNFLKCTDKNGKSPSIDVFTAQDGRYYGLMFLGDILLPQYILNGSNTKTHTEIQTEFLYDRAAMMFNGSWLMNEMGSKNEKIASFPVPVISDITKQLSTVKNEKLLRELITAIDQVNSGEKQLSDFASGNDYLVAGSVVSANDWDRVMEARGIVGSNYQAQNAYIPTYADQIEGAKEFLKYMYSDEGLKIYGKNLKSPLPMRLSTGEEITTTYDLEFEENQYSILRTSFYLAEYANYHNVHKIFAEGGATRLANMNVAGALSANNANDRMTAQEIWDEFQSNIQKNYDSWLFNIK